MEDYQLDCPYCGENLDILIDCSVPQQEYVEDCQVCCSPIVINVQIGSDGTVEYAQGRAENE